MLWMWYTSKGEVHVEECLIHIHPSHPKHDFLPLLGIGVTAISVNVVISTLRLPKIQRTLQKIWGTSSCSAAIVGSIYLWAFPLDISQSNN